jgi:cytoskeletal protein CcmA (bactofilin family)
MFSKPRTNPEETPERRRTGGNPPAPSIISTDMRISGDLRTDGDIQVDGVVDGDIQSTTLSVGKTAEINGEVTADVVRVWGRVNGRIRGRDVTLLETAEVNGDILHESLEVARGAQLDGMVKRQSREEPKPSGVSLVVSDGEPASAKPPAKAAGKPAAKVAE